MRLTHGSITMIMDKFRRNEMKYGIKVTWEDGVETFMMSFAEYTTAGGDEKPAEYASAQEAEDAAQNMRLLNYRVVPLNG